MKIIGAILGPLLVVPVVSFCGPNAFLKRGSSDVIGQINGSWSETGCRLIFSTAWGNPPLCAFSYDNQENDPVKIHTIMGKKTYVYFPKPHQPSKVLDYECVGYE